MVKTIKKLKMHGLNNMHVHQSRLGEFPFIQQVVQVNKPQEVQIWNYKIENPRFRHYMIVSTQQVIERETNEKSFITISDSKMRTKTFMDLLKEVENSPTLFRLADSITQDPRFGKIMVLSKIYNQTKEYMGLYKQGDYVSIIAKTTRGLGTGVLAV